MKKVHKILFIIVVALVFLTPTYGVKANPLSTVADGLKEQTEQVNDWVREGQNIEITEEGQQENVARDCKYIFGDPNDESSTAYMIQKFLNYAKVLAPLLVILLSGFDFVKTTLTGDADQMKKAGKKLGIRLACAVGVFLAPFLVSFIINFINRTSVDQTCNIK